MVDRLSNGCAYDLMCELIAEAEHQAHLEGRCPGAPVCVDCQDEQKEADETIKAR